MLSGVSIVCFAASYTVTLLLEISRMVFRSGVRGAVMLGFAGAGLVAHTLYLFYRAVEAEGSPLSSQHAWYLIAAWLLMVVYLCLVYYRPHTNFGLFLLPLVLGLIAAAWWVKDRQPFDRESASRIWGAVHGISILLATVALLMAFAAGLMYLGQARRLKQKRPPISGLRLPSLEWLRQTNGRAILVSAAMLGVGLLSGVILAVIGQRSGSLRVGWTDPVVLSSAVMFACLLTALALGACYRPTQQGRKVAYLTIIGFGLLVVCLVWFVQTQHGAAGNGAAVPGASETVPRKGSP